MEDSYVVLLYAFDAPAFASLLLNLPLHLLFLNNPVFLFPLQHWFPLLHLAYKFLLCSV